MNDESQSFVGLTVEQVRCAAPDYQHMIGRQGRVLEAFTDEKGQIHLMTDDGVWCPLRLCSVIG
jgi:hypothetical protein